MRETPAFYKSCVSAMSAALAAVEHPLSGSGPSSEVSDSGRQFATIRIKELPVSRPPLLNDPGPATGQGH